MRYESLAVYRKSYELALSMYKFSNTLPKEERYGITAQLRSASLSIPLNIAEGYGKQSSEAEFNRFLSMAKGSCNEVCVLLDFLKDLKFLEKEHHNKYIARYEEVEKMLYVLMKSVMEK